MNEEEKIEGKLELKKLENQVNPVANKEETPAQKVKNFTKHAQKVYHVNINALKTSSIEILNFTGKDSPWHKFWFGVSLGVASLAIFMGIYVFVIFAKDLPDENTLAKYRPIVTSRFYANNGQLLKEHSTERRVFVPKEKMPEMLVKAFISAEDKNFYSHNGLDFQGIARAIIVNLRRSPNQRLVGASTITQQVAKNFFMGSEQTFTRKIKEAISALKIDKKFSKDQILTLYLNQIYLGWRAYGVAAAATSYFDKTLDELTLAEMAYLAAIPKGPANYDPITKKEAAIIRRNWVLDRMREDGYISAYDCEKAKAEDLVATKKMEEERPKNMDYFAEEVRKYLEDNYGSDALKEGGYIVKTTADPLLQNLSTKALRKYINDYDIAHGYRGALGKLENTENWKNSLNEWKANPSNTELLRGVESSLQLAVVLSLTTSEAKIGLENGDEAKIAIEDLKWARKNLPNQEIGEEPKTPKDVFSVGDIILTQKMEEEKIKYVLRQVPNLEGAVVALDPHNGQILSMVGGYSFFKSNFNRALNAIRQPGSTIKPFIYLTALENNYTPSSILMDAPVVMEKESGEMWKPDNYGMDFQGEITLRRSLENSVNNSTLKLALDIGVRNVLKTAIDFGIYKDDSDPNLSKAIGSGATTPINMVAAYGMLVNGGKKITPYFIERVQDREGATVYRHDERKCDDCYGVDYTPNTQPPVLEDNREQLAEARSVYQIVNILQGAVQRGTGVAARVPGYSIAGKTGTSNDAKDLWFVGFSPDLVVGVFLGFDTPSTLGKKMAGGGVAAPIFREIMKEYLKDKRAIPFRAPPNVNFVKVNRFTGAPVDDQDSEEEIITEVFKEGMEDNFDDNIALRNKRRSGYVFRVKVDDGFDGEDSAAPSEDTPASQEETQAPTPTDENKVDVDNAQFGGVY
jgi:penicillin-binding protein 1A